jgi:hypothetical protein
VVRRRRFLQREMGAGKRFVYSLDDCCGGCEIGEGLLFVFGPSFSEGVK